MPGNPQNGNLLHPLLADGEGGGVLAGGAKQATPAA